MSISARISRASTPVSRWTICVLCIIWYLLIPIADRVYYSIELRSHAYPTNADSIGIPIMQGQIAWQSLAPAYLALLVFAVATYTGGHSFLLYDRTRPIWSFFWSAPLLLLCVVQLGFALFGLRHLQLLDLTHNTLLVYLLLAIRSSLVTYSPKLISRATNVI